MTSFLSNEDYAIISRLLSFLSSSYGGKNARLKFIQTLDQSMSICTSMSKRIQAQIKCQHRISRLLFVAIEKQLATYHDGGLYFSLIFCQFLIQFRDLTMNLNRKMTLFHSCLNLLDQMEISKVNLTFNSIQLLIALVRSVICKSLAYKNSDFLREHLCLLSVKSYLEKITLINFSKQQLILTIQGLDIEQSTLYDGLIYQLSTYDSALCSQQTRTCLYFSNSLAGDYTMDNLDHIETDQQMFEWIAKLADRIVEQIIEYQCLHHGGVIFCQKVIHPSVKIQLKKYGILTIDRLGRQYTPYFCYLTGLRKEKDCLID